MKHIHTTITVLIIFASVLLFASCEDVVQVDIDSEDLDLITVEAYVNTSARNNVLVKLEKSLPVDNPNANPAINGAIVEITDDTPDLNSIILEEEDNSGIYKLPQNKTYETKPGRTYKLTITSPDGTIITGEDYLQKVEPIDTVKVNLSSRGDFEYLGVFISTQETPGPGHFYKWDVYINNHLLYDSDNMAFANDELVDGNYIFDLEIFTDWYEDEDIDENGETESDRVIFVGDTVKVVQSAISNSTYNFYLGMQNQAFSGGPFSVPPANIPGNLKASNNKKVLGLFSARDISVGNEVVVSDANFTPLTPSINF